MSRWIFHHEWKEHTNPNHRRVKRDLKLSSNRILPAIIQMSWTLIVPLLKQIIMNNKTNTIHETACTRIMLQIWHAHTRAQEKQHPWNTTCMTACNRCKQSTWFLIMPNLFVAKDGWFILDKTMPINNLKNIQWGISSNTHIWPITMTMSLTNVLQQF